MSNRFDEILGKKKEDGLPPPQGQEWYMDFECICGEWVESATLYRMEGLIVWECSNGHRSWLEDFYV